MPIGERCPEPFLSPSHRDPPAPEVGRALDLTGVDPDLKQNGAARSPPPSAAAGRGFAGLRAAAIALFGLVVAACGPDEVSHSPLPVRTSPPDTSALTQEIRTEGGPLLLELTGWVPPSVIDELERGGLRPLPGYQRVERLDSMGLNLVGGTAPAGSLDRILALPYIVSVRPADVVRKRE